MTKAFLKGKVAIVTGGTGSIGAEIVRQLLDSDVAAIRVYSRDEHKQHEMQQELPKDSRLRFFLGDVRDKDRMDTAFQDADLCFHAAALKHVPFCEYNPFEAIKTNIIGTQNVIDLAIKHNLEKVVAISTDKAVYPTSVLGTSKLMMEKLITAANHITGKKRTRFASVRFGNVLSSRGSVAPIWIKQLERGEPLTITDKRATRFFMEIPEAVGLVFDAMDMMRGGEIFVLKMKRKVKILDYAKGIAAKYAPDRNVVFAFIGLRPGEKLHEELLTADEAGHALDIRGMFVVLPQQEMQSLRSKPPYKRARVAQAQAYRSNN